MGRLRSWWSRQNAAGKAAYGTAVIGAVAVLIGSAVQGSLPVLLTSGRADGTGSISATGIATTATPGPARPSSPTAAEPKTHGSTTPPDPSMSVGSASTESSAPDDGEGGVSAPPTPPVRYLADLIALRNDGHHGSYSMSAIRYDRSVRASCGAGGESDPQVWGTAGYTRLRAVVGLADDNPDALGIVARVNILDQNETVLQPVFEVALNRPAPMVVALNGAVQLQIACTGRNSATGKGRSVSIVLGDARLER
jgi:hypothetical protein